MITESTLSDIFRMTNRESILIGFGSANCGICEIVHKYFKAHAHDDDRLGFPAHWYLSNKGIFLAWSTIEDTEQTKALGFNFRMFPTLIGYSGGKPIVGWEGFALMAPEEMKMSMVQGAVKTFSDMVSHTVISGIE
jgi:hypothetical protein